MCIRDSLMEVMELREELEARPAAPRLLELRDQNCGEAERLGAAFMSSIATTAAATCARLTPVAT